MTASPAFGRRAALAVIVLVAFGLRAWNLEQQGWGADYYSAAVLSMSGSLHNFFFAAFDPAGFISIDKPPLAFWLQVLVVKLFGFTPLALLLPQVLIGTACVALVHRIARHSFGEMTGLLAASFMAITPVLVAVNRTNNTDSTLLLCLLAAAWAQLVATERGSRRWLAAAWALLGLAFNVKMLAGVLVLPVFGLVYLLLAPVSLARRVADLALATAALLLVALPWAATVQLTAPANRPHIGSSPGNSMIELVFGHNARNRLYSPRATAASADAAAAGASAAGASAAGASVAEPGLDTRSTVRELAARLFVRNPVGPLRLLWGQPAAQIGWFAPLLLFGAVVGALGALRHRASRPAETATRSGPGRASLATVFWAGWLLGYWATYSQLGGIIHHYYLSTMAPALAILGSAAVCALWRSRRERVTVALLVLLPLSCLVWQAHVQASAMGWTSAQAFWTQREGWLVFAHASVALVLVVAALLFTVLRFTRADAKNRLAAGAFAATLAASSVLPLLWSASSVVLPAPGIVPSADLYRWQAALRDPQAFAFMRYGRGVDTSRLAEFVLRERRGEQFLLSTTTTYWAAPLIIATGAPVMARGGYHGLDRAIGVERLVSLVRDGKLRFALIDDALAVSRRMGADEASQDVTAWVRANGRPVDASRWRSPSNRGAMQLYDLRPVDP